MIRFASLGSGSQGNALIVDVGETKLLLDCGFSVRATSQRLGRLGVSSDEITALLVTHEHSDHVAGVCRFAGRHGIPVFLTHGTYIALSRGQSPLPEYKIVDSHLPFSIGSIEIQPFPVPHDAREPVQYVFGDGKRRLGVLTDTGTITPHIVERLNGCDALVLECNHDPDMLASSTYPYALKQRIAGSYGHLGNEQAASLFGQIKTTCLQHVVAAHLSEQNNRPALARHALSRALDCGEDWVCVADQENGFAWRELG